MKKPLIALLLLTLVLSAFSASPLAEEVPEVSASGEFEYTLLRDGTAQITKYNGSAEALEIPVELDGHAVSGIGYRSFFKCGGLTSVTIPDSVTDIGANPFWGCSDLKEIVVSPDHPCLEVVDGALVNRPDMRLICYPCASNAETAEIPRGIRIIGDYAFDYCAGLTSVTIPDSVTAVGANPFAYCDALREIAVSPDHPCLEVVDGALISRPDMRLVCCPGALTVRTYGIPQGIRVIGDRAFADCKSLASVTIPDSVTSIGARAFYGCESLTALTIPAGVTNVGEGVFYDCGSLVSVTIPDGVTAIGVRAFYRCTDLASVTLPEGVKSIGDWAFCNCDSLTAFTIPEGVTAIGNSAFSSCDSLQAVTIPDSVTDIGDLAFRACHELTSVTIPDSVTAVGTNPFMYCDALQKIIVSPDHPGLEVVDGVLFGRRDRRLICYPCGFRAETYEIPRGTEIIGDLAFSDCDNLKSVTIPDSVTAVGANPFDYCYRLKEIVISPDHPCLEKIGGALYSRPDSRLVCYPCALSAETYEIPQGTEIIGDYAFSDSDKLKTVTIPDSVTAIGYRAFRSCGGLKTVTIPDSVTSIGGEVFALCDSLKTVTIPDSVTSIGEDAFDDCPDLTLAVGRGSFAEGYCRNNDLPYVYAADS